MSQTPVLQPNERRILRLEEVEERIRLREGGWRDDGDRMKGDAVAPRSVLAVLGALAAKKSEGAEQPAAEEAAAA